MAENSIKGVISATLAEDEVKFTDTQRSEPRPKVVRKTLKNSERASDFFSRMGERTKLTFDLQTVGGADGSKPYSGSKFERIILASVQTDLRLETFQRGSKKPAEHHFDSEVGMLLAKDEQREAIWNNRARALAKSIDKGAHIISFCEFGLPPVDIDISEIPQEVRGDPFHRDFVDCVDTQYQIAATKLLEAAKQQSRICKSNKFEMPFVFYGSAHCVASRYNLGVVSPGHPIEDSYSVTTNRRSPIGEFVQSKEIEKNAGSGPIAHKKRFPAHRMGERARVPDNQNFRTYQHPLGQICVLISSDSLDLNQFFNIVKINNEVGLERLDRIFLVVVPSFNRSEDMMQCCEDLSALAGTNVLVTNAIGELAGPRRKTMPRSELFFDGMPSNQLVDEELVITSESDSIRLYDIDVIAQSDWLRRER